MTKKDYENIASVFASYSTSNAQQEMARAVLARDIADMLAEDDPRFNQDWFLKACGVKVSEMTE